MSFTIKAYKNLSENNIVDKNIIQLGSDLTGVLKEDCSIINPVILIEDIPANNMADLNYLYIAEFNRYYYVNNIVINNNHLFELHCHVDVLKTYRTKIRNCNAVISRQENMYNLYLQDGVFKTKAFPHIEIRQFPSGFSDFNFIFTVAG